MKSPFDVPARIRTAGRDIRILRNACASAVVVVVAAMGVVTRLESKGGPTAVAIVGSKENMAERYAQ